MKKHAYAVQMSYEVTGEEKATAEKALIIFNATNNFLDKAKDYLDIIYNAFSGSEVDVDQVWKYRAALRKYRDNSINKFNQFKIGSFNCVRVMNSFSFDTQTIKLIKSFTNAVEELESMVNDYVDLFDDLKSKDFSSDVVKSIDKIRNKCDEISALIDDRIKPHIKNNILSKNWVSSVSDELQMKIEKKVPLMIDIYQDKNKE